ncbi:DUF4936 domain-containing protein [Zoogloeaceae bacteirum Par-f-2]|jgi:hypothetical protein|uniref:DUF4936 family protein n=1 Tax=Pseudothauera hydrothermalis TaxID=2184083 RepID=UPI000C7D7909|nr:DUF4936 family protein [Pseudothauera hydrothermalis]AUL99840.1 DUF4936 domain-containing protein [Rhodocyclaceae bacterium]AVZ79044.1 DUF4936 domain-containing protein [Zoogloeaceae bacteirum Par-f-2]
MDRSTEPIDFYVYFRLREDIDQQDAAAGILAMQAALARRTGVSGRLMRRRGDPRTWMEIYEAVTDPAGFEHALAETVAEHKLGELLEPGSARHLEQFVQCV